MVRKFKNLIDSKTVTQAQPNLNPTVLSVVGLGLKSHIKETYIVKRPRGSRQYFVVQLLPDNKLDCLVTTEKFADTEHVQA